MPGKVVDVLVNEGDIIGVGKTLNNIRCNENGKYLKVRNKSKGKKVLLKKMRQFQLNKIL